MAMHLTHHEMEAIPSKWLEVIVHFISGFRNDTVDFGRPHLRSSFQRLYPLFVFLYGALVICGTACNAALLFSVFSPTWGERATGRRRRSDNQPTRTVSPSTRSSEHVREGGGGSPGSRDGGEAAGGRGDGACERDPTLCLLANLAAADVVKCLVVLPVSLAVLLVQNWVFGSFMCFFVPMMQDIPIHVSMLSFLLIAADRHRLLMDPMKPRFPPLFCSLAAWLLAICIVLPYPVYTTYLDLGAFMKDQFQGVGICIVNLGDDMQEYMRGLFIAMYVVPLAVIAFLYVRVSRELKMLREGAEESTSLGVRGPMLVESAARREEGEEYCSLRPLDHLPTTLRGDTGPTPSHCAVSGELNCEGGGGITGGRSSSSRGQGVCCEEEDAELNVTREQRTQKYLIAMVVAFAACLFPLMVLRLTKLALAETYENSAHFDIVFAAFVWVAFLPTTSTPCLYAAWRLSRPKKERLRECFRFGSQRRSRPDEEEDYLDDDDGRGGGCGAVVLLGSRRRRRNRRHRRDVCRLTRQQPHRPTSDTSVQGLNNVAFAHPQLLPAVPYRQVPVAVAADGNVASGLGGGGDLMSVGDPAAPAVGSSQFVNKESFS